ncbi:MAG: hypothetical protein ABIA92_01225 [Patescibacteria group bacterium]
MDILKLINRVKASRLLSKKEQKYWLKKMESMNEKDLEELNSILEYAEKIDWEVEIPKYASAVSDAEKLVSKTVENLALS